MPVGIHYASGPSLVLAAHVYVQLLDLLLITMQSGSSYNVHVKQKLLQGGENWHHKGITISVTTNTVTEPDTSVAGN